MGPIALFDKSFLQSLSLDESVWFDNFFYTNVCPYFFVETLADLKKTTKSRTSKKEVEIIAEKFPDMNSAPCANHLGLCLNDLLGKKPPMTGQIPVAGGKIVKVDNQTSAVFGESPEADAFFRWQRGEFLEIEHLYARDWRNSLSNLDLDQNAQLFKSFGVSSKSCKTLMEAKILAQTIVVGISSIDTIKLALYFLNVPTQLHGKIFDNWKRSGYLPLSEYAPYAAFVATVEIFFQIALAANLISSNRPSNLVDIAYLFYLPFCMFFVSSDQLHRKCAPLFLRQNQQFVWGEELKDGLRQLNDYYLQFPESEKEKSVMSFADQPPKEGDFLVTQLWDRLIPKWREPDNKEMPTKEIKDMERLMDAPPLRSNQIDVDPIKVDSALMKRVVRMKKGSWYQAPKNLKTPRK